MVFLLSNVPSSLEIFRPSGRNKEGSMKRANEWKWERRLLKVSSKAADDRPA